MGINFNGKKVRKYSNIFRFKLKIIVLVIKNFTKVPKKIFLYKVRLLLFYTRKNESKIFNWVVRLTNHIEKNISTIGSSEESWSLNENLNQYYMKNENLFY